MLFLNEHLLNRRGVGLLDHYERGRNLPVSALNFYQIQHAKIGGATTFRTLWCYNWPSKLTVIPSFKRTISHFLDFGVQTGTKLSDTQVQHDHITCSDFLPFNKLENEILIRDSPSFL